MVQDTILRFAHTECRRYMWYRSGKQTKTWKYAMPKTNVGRVQKTVRGTMQKVMQNVKKIRVSCSPDDRRNLPICIAALEWLAHSPPEVRELILAYTNNALSRQC